MSPNPVHHPQLSDSLHRDFIGLDTRYRLADGRVTRRHYLDSAASTLALRFARQVADELLRHYANTHSELHFSARVASHAYDWAHEQVLKFAGPISTVTRRFSPAAAAPLRSIGWRGFWRRADRSGTWCWCR